MSAAPSLPGTGHAAPWPADGPPLRRAVIMAQRWERITFLHWPVDPERVAPFLPPGTRPDVHDGAGWVGLIPFHMVGAGVGRGPAVPWLGTFAETNVRLYTVDEQGRHGVVFRSLEATRLAVVLGARAVFRTPYCWAGMSIEQVGDVLTYRTRRRLPGPRGAGGLISVRVGGPVEPSPLDVFLTARFGLHTRALGRTWWVPNTHTAWPLRSATLLDLHDDLVAAAGFPGVVDQPPPSVLHSTGVRTEFGLPQLLR